jgi:hypothetical protein
MLAGGATARAAGEQTATDPLREGSPATRPALQRARDALVADPKSDLAAALSALADAAEQAIATLERAAPGPPPTPPAGSRPTLRGPML